MATIKLKTACYCIESFDVNAMSKFIHSLNRVSDIVERRKRNSRVGENVSGTIILFMSYQTVAPSF